MISPSWQIGCENQGCVFYTEERKEETAPAGSLLGLRLVQVFRIGPSRRSGAGGSVAVEETEQVFDIGITVVIDVVRTDAQRGVE